MNPQNDCPKPKPSPAFVFSRKKEVFAWALEIKPSPLPLTVQRQGCDVNSPTWSHYSDTWRLFNHKTHRLAGINLDTPVKLKIYLINPQCRKGRLLRLLKITMTSKARGCMSIGKRWCLNNQNASWKETSSKLKNPGFSALAKDHTQKKAGRTLSHRNIRLSELCLKTS